MPSQSLTYFIAQRSLVPLWLNIKQQPDDIGFIDVNNI